MDDSSLKHMYDSVGAFSNPEDVLHGSFYATLSHDLNDVPGLRKVRKLRKPSDIARCQVDDCGKDLSETKPYLRRYSVCEEHFKAEVAVIQGQKYRFCQQCNKFQYLSEFHGSRRSCRMRSEDRNYRRRQQRIEGKEKQHRQQQQCPSPSPQSLQPNSSSTQLHIPAVHHSEQGSSHHPPALLSHPHPSLSHHHILHPSQLSSGHSQLSNLQHLLIANSGIPTAANNGVVSGGNGGGSNVMVGGNGGTGVVIQASNHLDLMNSIGSIHMQSLHGGLVGEGEGGGE
eukprot:CAMPEP_0175054934 /NCGR_PEP_ID=MMETSP0052_2-20121109/9785_1 /TAXON_ID=51329 ORGANISM="Polytomella parva, Strain SAG 63-3" /NCGR_SAMPLE_ID=MMETSP0052_2 /ASSEMBLY_ACC=CAM_ASM_000194 /LENGTH=284 /DNA_ID=CAMNT_0016319693 /DNA_START=92 /DNA_END=943 /DNA_ORIENTATION=-